MVLLPRCVPPVSYTHLDVYKRQVFEPNKEISLEDAQKIDPNATYEDKVEVQLNTKEFGRIAAPVSYTHLDVYKRQV